MPFGASGQSCALCAVTNTPVALIDCRREELLKSLLREERALNARAHELHTQITAIHSQRQTTEQARLALADRLTDQKSRQLKTEAVRAKLAHTHAHWLSKVATTTAKYGMALDDQRMWTIKLRQQQNERTRLTQIRFEQQRELARLAERVSIISLAASKIADRKAGLQQLLDTTLATYNKIHNGINSGLESQIAKLSERHNKLLARSTEQHRIRTELMAALAKLTAERAEQERSESAARSELAALTAKLAELTAKLDQLNAYQRQFQADLAGVQKETTELHQFIRDHQTLLTTHTAKQRALQVEYTHTNHKLNGLKQELTRIADESSAAQIRNQALSDSIASILKETATLNQSVRDASTRSAQRVNEKVIALAARQQLTSEFDAATALYEQNAQHHDSIVLPIRMEIDLLERALVEHNKNSKLASDSIAVTQQRLIDHEQNHDQRLREVADLRENWMRTVAKADSLQENLESTKTQLKSHHATNESLGVYLKEIDKQTENMRATLATADQTVCYVLRSFPFPFSFRSLSLC